MKYSKAEYKRDDPIGPRDYEVCTELGISPKVYHGFVEAWEEQDGCLVWTRAVSKMGKVKIIIYGNIRWFNFHYGKYNGCPTHRLRLTFKLGRQLKPDHVAGHHCSNTLCGRHVSEITYSQNGGLDRIRDGTVEDTARGTKHGRAKLTEGQVKQIWKRTQNGEEIHKIAKDYPEVSAPAIYQIKYGFNWNCVTGLPRLSRSLKYLKGQKVSDKFMTGSLVKVVGVNLPSMTVTGKTTDYGYLWCKLPHGGVKPFAPNSLILDK